MNMKIETDEERALMKKTKRQLVGHIEGLIEQKHEAESRAIGKGGETIAALDKWKRSEEARKDGIREIERLLHIIGAVDHAVSTYDSVMFKHSVLDMPLPDIDQYMKTGGEYDERHDSQEARFLRLIAGVLSGRIVHEKPRTLSRNSGSNGLHDLFRGGL